MDMETQSDRAKILIVDDLLENLRLLSTLLVEEGYDVRRAPDGEMAISNVPRFRPDLILLDIMMPEMNGYEVCTALKSDARTRDIPIIFLSALDLTFDKVKAFELGAVDYINKPFHPAEVLARVRNQLRVRQQEMRLRAQHEVIEAQQKQIDEALRAQQLAEEKCRRLMEEVGV